MKAVLFDMFGVVAMDQSPTVRAQMVEYSGHEHGPFWEAYWAWRHSYDRGEKSGHEYWKAVGERLSTPFTSEEAERLIALDLDSWSRINGETVEVVRGLAEAGTPLGLLSNIPEELARRFEERFQHVFDLFPVLGLSCRIGSAKPERPAFDWCLERLGVPAEDVLFVDDNATNISAARELGMRAHLFRSVPELRRAVEWA